MGCEVYTVEAPNGQDSIQYARIRRNMGEENGNNISKEDKDQIALAAWLIPKSNAFMEQMPVFQDAEFQKTDQYKKMLDKNGELMIEYYYVDEILKNPVLDAEITKLTQSYVADREEMHRVASDVIVNQTKILKELQKRDLNNGESLSEAINMLESAGTYTGKSLLLGLIKTSGAAILTAANQLDRAVLTSDSVTARARTTAIYKQLQAFDDLRRLGSVISASPTLSKQYASEKVLLDKYTVKFDHADSVYQKYVKNIVAEEYSALSDIHTKEDIILMLESIDMTTSAWTAKIMSSADSADAIIALTAKLISDRQENARKNVLKIEDKMAGLVTRLEKLKGTSNPEELYSDFLMKDKNGNVTNKLISSDPRVEKKLIEQGGEIAEIYQEYRKIYQELNTLLPQAYRNNNMIPSVDKSTMERLQSGNNLLDEVKRYGSEKVQSREEDTATGQRTDKYNNVLNMVPIFYTQKTNSKLTEKHRAIFEKKGLKGKELTQKANAAAEAEYGTMVSKDLGNSLMAFAEMAHNYKQMNNILFVAEGARDFVSVRGVVPKGTDLKKAGTTAKSGVDLNAIAQITDLIEMQMYSKREKDLGSFTILGTDIKIDNRKLLNNLRAYNATLLMSFNVLAATSNVLMGETMQFAEAMAKEFYGYKQYSDASYEYAVNTINFAEDSMLRIPKSKIGLMNRLYDVLGDYRADSMEAGHGTIKKLDIQGATMFLQHSGEHMMQTRAFMALMKTREVFDAKGNSLGNLWDAHEVVDGKVKVKDSTFVKVAGELVKYDLAQEKRITRNAQEMLRRMHGNYSDKTAAAAQKNAIINLAYQFRKWIPTGINRRFGKEQYNEFADAYREGNYITTARWIQSLASDMLSLGDESKAEWHRNMSDMQKANVRRTVTEAGVLLFAIAAGTLLMDMAEDDEDNPLINFGIYAVKRLQSELLFYVNPKETWAILKSPAATANTVEAMAGVAFRAITPWNWDEEYESGRHKGEKKIVVQTKKLIPVYKQLDRTSRQGLKAQADLMSK